MHVLLIRPPSHHCIETEVPEAVRRENVSYPPLSLLAIATWLKLKTYHKATILDGLLEQLSFEALQQRIATVRPDVVGITTFTVGLVDCQRTIEAARAAGVRYVILGGPHVNDFPYESSLIPGIDAALFGEGQVTLPALLDALEAGAPLDGLPGVLLPGSKRPEGCVERPVLDDDLDTYPFADLRLIAYDRYYDVLGQGELFTTLITSRGCPYKCSFCNTPRDRYRTMSAQRICEEIQERLNMGIREIYFVDDTFNITNARVVELCREILKRKLSFRWTARFRVKGVDRELLILMKQAGCNRLQFGVEQATDEALEFLQKGVNLAEVENAFRLCREVGIQSVAYFMIGTPTERTKADLLRTIDFSVGLDPDFVMFNILTPFPGTTLFDQGLERGILRLEPWMQFLTQPDPGFKPQNWDEFFTMGELAEYLDLAYKRFYLRPKFVVRSLKQLSSMKDFQRKARAGLALISPKLAHVMP